MQTMPEYPLATLISIIVVCGIELFWLKTGIFRTAQYWIAMLIVFAFQILVDGWLTKLYDPIVIYNPDTMWGLRFPYDIPVEDFGFGFAMVTLAVMIWKKLDKSPPNTATHHQQQQPPNESSQHDHDTPQQTEA